MGVPILGEVIGGVKDIISEIIVDKDKKNEILARIDERYHEQMMGQIETNQIEAGHRSIFVAGWRPFIGWVGGTAIAWSFIVGPFLQWITGWPLPDLDVGELMTLVMTMLGVGAMRSYDKAKGTSNDVLKRPTIKLPKAKGKPVNILPEDAPWMQ